MNSRHLMHLAVLALLAQFSLVPADAQEPSVQITFLNVGQGDAVVIRAPEGQTAMIDAGRGVPLRFLQQMGVEEIDLLVATHPHADHIGGIDDVLTARPVRFYMDNGQPHTTATYERLMATLQRLEGVTYLEAVPREISLGSASIEVLPLLPPESTDHNNRSVGLVLRFGAFSAFLSGDSEELELTHFLQQGSVPDVTLLKAPHHGSADGFTNEFLDQARPEIVVISVGEGNSYLHPRPEALTAFGSVATHVFRTDRDGHVTVLGYADGRFEVVVDRELVASGSAGPRARPRLDADEAAELLSMTVVAGTPGDRQEDLNAEYAVIESHSPTVLNVGRWRLCDVSSRCFRFPDDTRIDAGGRLVVYTGYGVSDGASFFMNHSRAVWNDDGDEATLFDALGNPVVRYVYE
jgi:competence protein ComEC